MFTRNSLELPKREIIIDHILESLIIYFSSSAKKIRVLPMAVVNSIEINIPLKLIEIELPEWGMEAGINGKILVPEESATKENANWTDVDWFMAAFLLLESCHERTWELQKSNVKSYSLRLRKWDRRAWDSAWVNRIGIFLALWNDNDCDLSGMRKNLDLRISHDVDAISKTFRLKLKQGTFNFFNTIRKSNTLEDFKINFAKSLNFITHNSEMNNILQVLKIENKYGIISTFNLYSKLSIRGIKSWFLDPSYDLEDLKKYGIPQTILDHHCDIGMHGSIKSSKQLKRFQAEKNKLEVDLNIKIRSHRQHWLSFYWEKSFQVYDASKIQIDSTLMFNDISGFRNSACLRWKPWNFQTQKPHLFFECPTLIMDSHIYDYAENTNLGFYRALEIMEEVELVGGQGQILWHPHTLSTDYGWESGFEYICSKVPK
jgi:hypothetical protein